MSPNSDAKALRPLAPPPRPRGGHKGDFGRVLIVAGSRSMPGAAYLAAMGALRGGAGLVTLATPRSALPLVAPCLPCATFLPLAEDSNGQLSARAIGLLEQRAALADVVALGPGLGRGTAIRAVVRALLECVGQPLVLDADGLNALAGEPERLARRSGPTVITPHPREFARVFGGEPPTAPARRRSAAESAAREGRCIVCLKGRGTVVTDGRSTFVNDTGNPGMATGGTGDVLSGIAAALLAVYPKAVDAAVAAVHVHGRAGDLAARARGETALIASDLLEHLGGAFQSLARAERRR